MADEALAARLTQLEQAKSLVEADASYFPQIVVGVLPVFDDPFVELRRWVADFVLLAMSSRKLSAEDKQDLALKCLEKLCVSTASEQDVTTAKSFIQITTIIYPLIFRYVANNPQSFQIWKNLSTLKSAILRFWDAEGEGLKICCVKFAQRVITAQSFGSKDPRLANKEDVSLNIVIADHPLLIERDLNAEAQALLDRIILVLQERPADPVLMVAATNCLCVLAKVRLSFTSKIIGAILSCDVSNIVDADTTTKAKLQIKFVEKAIRVTLTHLLKINAAGPFGNKIQQYLLGRAKRSDDENIRKRQASETVDNAGKRLRTDIDGAGTPQPSVLSIPPLPEGAVNLATIFNLANDNTLASFDVNQLPQTLVVQIILATLTACNQDQLDSSVETIRARHTTVQNRPSTSVASSTATVSTTIDAAERAIKSNGTGETTILSKNNPVQPIVIAPESFEMPDALSFSAEALQNASSGCLERLLHTEPRARKPSALTIRESGLQRINGGAWDREAWTSILTRLCARGLTSSLESKVEDTQPKIRDKLRGRLLSFVMSNFRENIDFCASWLTEEWYSEQLDNAKLSGEGPYVFWTHKVLDAMIPFLESKDRLFMRFLSDLPELTATMLSKIRNLCVDPDRSQLGYTTLQYLVLLRPPVRTLCLDLVEGLYQEDKSESVQQERILSKWRPDAIIKEEPTSSAS